MMTKLLRHVVALGLVAAIAGSLLGAAAVPAGAAGRNTPANEILVVTANIEEAYTMPPGNDLASHFEIDNFAARVKQVVPQIPDVLLLQEVNYKTSALAAQKLSARLGQKFVVAVRPISNTTIEYPDKQVHTETAILLNANTMATDNKGGYFSATYPKSAAPAGGKVQVRRHAFMMAREKASGVKLPLVSLHFAMEQSFRTAKLSNYWRGRWSEQLKSLLRSRYNADSTRRVAVIGGDFNSGRCYTGDWSNCGLSAWWKAMQASPTPYVESGYQHGVSPRVDAIWTRGEALSAGWDEHGEFKESDRSRYYSDHRLRWAVVSPKR